MRRIARLLDKYSPDDKVLNILREPLLETNLFNLRMLLVITHDDLQQLLWSSISANLSRLLQDLDNDKIKETLELLLSLDHKQENVLTAIELIMNARNRA